MALSAKKTTQRRREAVTFTEERRVPLTNAARDQFLRSLDSKAGPNAAAKRAVRRYKQSRNVKKA
jgi:uncharacterized protein (DUF1778 family)